MSEESQSENYNPILESFMVSGLPHILLCPEKNPGWQKVRRAMDEVAKQIESLDPDVILVYSTYWSSVIGHQLQARKVAKWTLVDEVFHDLGSLPYELHFDSELADLYNQENKNRGLQSRTVDYEGFPIDTGSVVALNLLDPMGKRKAVVVSSNIYSDRAETIVLGKAARAALEKSGKTAVAVVVSSLSNRLLPLEFDPANDHIFSQKDEEWNRKLLEYLEEGRLEDVSQLSRQVHKEARVQKVNNFKPFWWLAAVSGQHNRYKGEVLAYEAIQGTGAAVVGLSAAHVAAQDLEYDEDDPENYAGERNVLSDNQMTEEEYGSKELS